MSTTATPAQPAWPAIVASLATYRPPCPACGRTQVLGTIDGAVCARCGASRHGEPRGVRVGDRVRALVGDGGRYATFFKAGDEGIVHSIDDDGDVWVDFSCYQGFRAHDGGVWCVAAEDLEVIS